MRGISVVVGLAVGAGSLIWLGNRGPMVLADGDHPLPSATARYERPRASGASRFLPAIFGGVSNPPQGASRDDSDWVEVPVLALDPNGRPLAGAEIETRTTEADLAAGRFTAAENDARIAMEEAVAGGTWDDAPPPLPPPPVSEPASHARISVARARTDADGRARVKVPPLVSVTLLARGARGEEGVSSPVYVVAQSASQETPAEVVIEAAPLAVLLGDVRDERGRAIADATVTIAPRDHEFASGIPELVALSGERGEEGTVYTDANGAFRIPLRRSGAYDVTIEAPGFQLHSEPAAQAMAGHESTLRVTMLEAASLRGRIVDASGAPIPGAYADLRGIEEASGAYQSVSTLTDGTFVAEGLPPGKYELRASAVDHRGARVDVTTNDARIEVRLEKAPLLTGTVVADLQLMGFVPDHSPEPEGGRMYTIYVMAQAAGAAVPLFSGADPRDTPLHEMFTPEPRSWAVATLDETGRGTFQVPGLPPGEVLLFLQYGTAQSRPVSARLVSGSTSRVELRLDRSTLVPPPAMEQVAVAELVDVIGLAEPEEGEAEEEVVEEPPPPFLPDVRLDAGPSGPFVVRAGVPASGPRVVGGDRVVAVNGTRLVVGDAGNDPHGQAQNALFGPEGTRVSITVERPATGETLTMTFVRTIAWEPPRHGCHFGTIREGEY